MASPTGGRDQEPAVSGVSTPTGKELTGERLERSWEATGIAPSELVKRAEDRGKQHG